MTAYCCLNTRSFGMHFLIAHHIVMRQHVGNSQMPARHQHPLLISAERLLKQHIDKVCSSGLLRPVVWTSAFSRVQSIAVWQNMLTLVTQAMCGASTFRFQHVHGDQAEVPSTGVIPHACMLQLVQAQDVRSHSAKFRWCANVK